VTLFFELLVFFRYNLLFSCTPQSIDLHHGSLCLCVSLLPVLESLVKLVFVCC
jgi:hypothetical protein